MWLKRKTLLILSLVCLIQLSAAKAECPLEPSIELVDLLRVAGTSDECLTEARLVFHQKYFDNTISIRGPFTDDENAAIKHRIFDIRLQNMNIIRTMLNTFGDLIHEINISFMEIDEVDGTAIIELIAANCQQSLRHFEIFSIKENVFDGLQNKTFPNVTEFYFSSASEKDFEIKGNATKFDRVFPSVVDLHLAVRRAGEWVLIGDDFPALKKLQVDLAQADGLEHSRHISSLIEHSSKIEDLSLTKPTHDILKAASTHLLGLRSISIRNAVEDTSNNNIFFRARNLRQLEFTANNGIPNNWFFNNLVYLTIVSDKNVSFSDDNIDFFKYRMNNDLFQLNLNIGHLTCQQLFNISNIFGELNTVNITSASEFSANNITAFAERLPSTLIIDLTIPIDESQINTLKSQLKKLNGISSVWVEKNEENQKYHIRIIRLGGGTQPDNGICVLIIILIIVPIIAALITGVVLLIIKKKCAGLY